MSPLSNNPQTFTNNNSGRPTGGPANGTYVQAVTPRRSSVAFEQQIAELTTGMTKFGLQPPSPTTAASAVIAAHYRNNSEAYTNMTGLGLHAGTPPSSGSQGRSTSSNVANTNSRMTSVAGSSRSQNSGPNNNIFSGTGHTNGQQNDHGPNNNDAAKQAYINEMASTVQARLADIQQLIRQMPADRCSREFKESLRAELSRLSQEFNETQRIGQKQWDAERKVHSQTLARLKAAEKELQDTQRQVTYMIEDRKRISSERDELQLKVNELRLAHKKSSERLSNVEKKWESLNNELIEQLQKQEEQLNGKRALWMSANPGSSARRDAMAAVINNPLQTPTHNSGFTPQSISSGQLSISNLSQYDESMKVPYGAPPVMKLPSTVPTGPASGRNLRHKANLPVGRPTSDRNYTSPQDIRNSSRPPFSTEPGESTLPSIPSNALVVRNTEYADPSPPYLAALSKLFDLIESWVYSFSDTPCTASDRAIASGNQILWKYMLDCTYPGRIQDAQVHSQTLLSDRRSRALFVFRMCIQYCMMEIVAVKTFKGFSKQIDNTIESVQAKLAQRGLALEVRQIYVNQQHSAIESIVEHSKFNNFRQDQLNRHTRALRDMLGPLLNANSARAEAGKALGAIVVHAWEMSVKMNTSYLSFQVSWPDTCAKFVASQMTARDAPNADPLMLQTKQKRCKLVITPVVTLRDDRGTTIRAKSLQRSDILLME